MQTLRLLRIEKNICKMSLDVIYASKILNTLKDHNVYFFDVEAVSANEKDHISRVRVFFNTMFEEELYLSIYLLSKKAVKDNVLDTKDHGYSFKEELNFDGIFIKKYTDRIDGRVNKLSYDLTKDFYRINELPKTESQVLQDSYLSGRHYIEFKKDPHLIHSFIDDLSKYPMPRIALIPSNTKASKAIGMEAIHNTINYYKKKLTSPKYNFDTDPYHHKNTSKQNIEKEVGQIVRSIDFLISKFDLDSDDKASLRGISDAISRLSLGLINFEQVISLSVLSRSLIFIFKDKLNINSAQENNKDAIRSHLSNDSVVLSTKDLPEMFIWSKDELQPHLAERSASVLLESINNMIHLESWSGDGGAGSFFNQNNIDSILLNTLSDLNNFTLSHVMQYRDLSRNIISKMDAQHNISDSPLFEYDFVEKYYREIIEQISSISKSNRVEITGAFTLHRVEIASSGEYSRMLNGEKFHAQAVVGLPFNHIIKEKGENKAGSNEAGFNLNIIILPISNGGYSVEMVNDISIEDLTISTLMHTPPLEEEDEVIKHQRVVESPYLDF